MYRFLVIFFRVSIVFKVEMVNIAEVVVGNYILLPLRKILPDINRTIKIVGRFVVNSQVKPAVGGLRVNAYPLFKRGNILLECCASLGRKISRSGNGPVKRRGVRCTSKRKRSRKP